MKIPTKIKVGRHWYRVQQVKDLSKTKGCRILGEVDYKERTIRYVHMSTRVDSNTFWHELTHAIIHDMGAKQNENFVVRFANRLTAAIDSAKFE